MQANPDAAFMKAGLYLCYMNYHATGEGVRSCIVVAGSEKAAKRLIKDEVTRLLSPWPSYDTAQ